MSVLHYNVCILILKVKVIAIFIVIALLPYYYGQFS